MSQSAGWNFADLWEEAAKRRPEALAQVQGERRFSWAAFDRRAAGIATALLDAGLRPPAKVALCLYNCPEYLETVFACFKVGLVPVNTNYRYREDELVYLWSNADAEAVVFHASLAERIAPARRRLPGVASWLCVEDQSAGPSWASEYERATASQPPTDLAERRTPDDIVLFYTGGTTGLPKGVVWRQNELFRAETADLEALDGAVPGDLGFVLRKLHAAGAVSLPASPLMHGTGFFSQLGVLSFGGAVVTLEHRSFDPVELLDAIEREKVEKLVIVGDVFAKPLLAALEREPSRWDISSLQTIVSAGAIWSQSTKRRFLEHSPTLTLWDSLGSSEAFGLARSISTGDEAAPTGLFVPTTNVRVLDENGRRTLTRAGEIGRLAVKGPGPVGYYKDPAASAAVFVTVDGDRYVVAGDWARVEADGSLTLLGRGSSSINTGGEKVFPEEVENVVRELTWVKDCVVVGVPDERWGEAVTAVVEVTDAAAADARQIVATVKARLAGYKAPRHVVFAPVERGPNGKVSHPRAREIAARAIAAP